MVAFGMFVGYLKARLASRDYTDDPNQLILEGIDRSGLTAWLFDANNIVEKMTRGNVGISAVVGDEQLSRFASRNAFGAVAGPSLGRVQDVMQIVGSSASSDWRESDTRAVRRVLPFQNLFYLRGLFDQVEEASNDVLGVQQ
jgi:hypothetical protein